MINDQIIILGRLVVVSPAPTDINPLCITALLDQRECRLAATLMAAPKPEALWWAMVGIRSVKSVKNLIENNKCVYKK